MTGHEQVDRQRKQKLLYLWRDHIIFCSQLKSVDKPYKIILNCYKNINLYALMMCHVVLKIFKKPICSV